MDLTYRTELRELNEQNLARFDAKLEQRLVESTAKFEQRLTELNAKLEQRLAELNAKLDSAVAKLDARMNGMTANLHAVLERRLGEQTRWFFVAWASLLIPIIGLWFRG